MAKNTGNNKVELPNILDKNEGGALAKLWAEIVNNNHLAGKMNILIDKYTAETEKMSLSSEPVKRKTKSSLINNIISKSLTWSVFLDLIFNFLKVKRVSLTIKLEWNNGDVTYDTIKVPNPNYVEDIIEEKKNDNTNNV